MCVCVCVCVCVPLFVRQNTSQRAQAHTVVRRLWLQAVQDVDLAKANRVATNPADVCVCVCSGGARAFIKL